MIEENAERLGLRALDERPAGGPGDPVEQAGIGLEDAVLGRIRDDAARHRPFAGALRGRLFHGYRVRPCARSWERGGIPPGPDLAHREAVALPVRGGDDRRELQEVEVTP